MGMLPKVDALNAMDLQDVYKRQDYLRAVPYWFSSSLGWLWIRDAGWVADVQCPDILKDPLI